MITAGGDGRVRTMSTSPAVRPSGLALTTTGPWVRLDLEPTTRSAALAELVGSRLGDAPETLQQRRLIAASLRAALREITAAGTVYAAVLVETLQDTVVQATFLASYADGRPGAIAGPAEEVELPIGPARRTVTTTEDDGEQALVVQYAAAVPESAQALLLSFSSPNLDHRDALLRLFDAIARAARWRYPAAG